MQYYGTRLSENISKRIPQPLSARLRTAELACFGWLPWAAARSPLIRSHWLLFQALRTPPPTEFPPLAALGGSPGGPSGSINNYEV